MAECITKLGIKQYNSYKGKYAVGGYSISTCGDIDYEDNEYLKKLWINDFNRKNYTYHDICNQLLLFSFTKVHDSIFIKPLIKTLNNAHYNNTIRVPYIDFLQFLSENRDIKIFKSEDQQPTYFMLTLTDNFWGKDSILPIYVLEIAYGPLKYFTFDVKWKLCWYISRAGNRVYYLPDGDDEFFITGNKQVEKLLEEGKLVMDKNKTYIKGNPKWVLDLELTYFDILAYHIVTCDAEEICLVR